MLTEGYAAVTYRAVGMLTATRSSVSVRSGRTLLDRIVAFSRWWAPAPDVPSPGPGHSDRQARSISVRFGPIIQPWGESMRLRVGVIAMALVFIFAACGGGKKVTEDRKSVV